MPEGWPGLRAPAEPHINWTSDGEPYPSAWLWVRQPDGTDDLWSSSVIPVIRGWGERPLREELLHRALRQSLTMAAELEAERDEFYAEWMPWPAVNTIGFLVAA